MDRYNSKFWNPGTEAIDAFTQEWAGENNWLVPPTYLVAGTVKYLQECKAKGTLIVPKWKSAVFWPLLFNEDGSPKEFVSRVVEYSPGGVLRHYRNLNALLGSARLKSTILVIRFI